jgi:hypothetical protein
MFAPSISKVQTKAAARSTNDLAPRRSTLGAHQPRKNAPSVGWLNRPQKCGPTCGCGECSRNAPNLGGSGATFNFARIALHPPDVSLAERKLANTTDGGMPAAPSPAPPMPADAGAPSPAKPACPAGQDAAKATGCIKPVVIADDDGKNPTMATSAATAQSIWAKCCIDFSISATQTINKGSFKKLEESPNNTPSAEETALFNEAGSSSCIQVFVPSMLKQGAREGKDISGGGGTYDAGTANPKIVLVEGAVPEVLAHEVGHASGYLGHDANATIMKPTGHYNVPNATAVSADVCSQARSGSVLTTGAAKDCCEKVP